MSERIGEENITNEGLRVKIADYFSWDNCTLIYEDGTKIYNIRYSHFKSGSVKKPVNRVGERHATKEGYEGEIIEYFGWDNCTIRFNDDRKTIIYNVRYSHVCDGSVSNPYHPSVYGVGYLGVGKYESEIEGEQTKVYCKWQGMLERCYSDRYQVEKSSYKACSVDERWHNFQVFGAWFEQNWKEYMQKWELDKDLLIKGNKVYSPETCCLVPQIINLAILTNKNKRGKYPIGVCKEGNKFRVMGSVNKKRISYKRYNTPEETFLVYKTAKEIYFKQLAEEWKDRIDYRAYEALYNWVIEITD